MSRFCLLSTLLVGLLIALPVAAQQTGGGQPDAPIDLQQSARQDAAIERRILAILRQLDVYNNVQVSVQAGVVTLTGETIDAQAVARMEEIVRRVAGVVAVKDEVTETTDVAERLTPSVERFVKRAEQTTAFLPLLVVALVAFALILSLGLFIASLKSLWQRLAPNPFIAEIYRHIVRLVFVVAGLVVALDILGATALLGSILGAAGVIGLAIGFAVRDTVENFLASIMLSIRQPFRPFDVVEINGDVGKVVRLTSRATILLSLEGNSIRIPNATVFKSRIVNFSQNREIQFQFDLGVDPVADLAAVQETGLATLRSLPFVLAEPPCNTWIDSIGDFTVNIRFTAWVDQSQANLLRARSEAIRLTKAAIEASGVALPEPTYRILTDLAAREPGGEPAASGRSKPIPAPFPVTDIANLDVEEERSLERMVSAERAQAETTDLLNPRATKE